jgi:hypothetical protein
MSITFAFYTLVQKKELTASKGTSRSLAELMPVFTSMTVFEVVKGQMGMVSRHSEANLIPVLLPHKQLCHGVGLHHAYQQLFE